MKQQTTFLIFLVIINWIQSASINREDAFNKVIRGLEEYRKSGTPPSYLEKAVKEYNVPNFFNAPAGTFDENEICKTCALTVDLMIEQRKSGMNDANFKKEVLFLCNLYEAFNNRVCEGMVELNVPIFLYIVDNTPNLNGTDVCGISYQYNDCDVSQRFKWTIDISEGHSGTGVKAKGEHSFNVLHISDVHYDPRYTAGKTNKCGEPVCCQDDQPDGANPADTCGYWSDYYDADIPWRTVVNALEQTKVHQYDYVYFTGDIVAHRIWNTSVEDNSKVISQILDAFIDYYKVPVYPSLGNHEGHPASVYSEISNASFTSQWLFDIMFQKLSKWLPIDEVKESILKGGYYTLSPRKGFRVIVLNNNVCNSGNWWLVHNPIDPYGQLKWLADTLLKAEQNNERVHLLYHMPSGVNECYVVWAREYRRIIDRFANIIAAQFNGHTHRDEFYIYYNKSNPDQAINMAWNGASITTYDKANPSYKIYSIDDETFDVLDFDEWAYNLTLANLNPKDNPVWYKLYSFKEAFGVKTMQADEINNLVMNMTHKHDLIDKYYRYKFRNGDVALSEGCDDDCKKDLLCTMVTTEHNEYQMCNKVKKLYEDSKKVKVTVV